MRGASNRDGRTDRGIRLFAAAHAIEEVLDVGNSAISGGRNRGFRLRPARQLPRHFAFGVDCEAVAVQLHRGTMATEDDVAAIEGAIERTVVYQRESGVVPGRIDRVGTFELRQRVAASGGLRGARRVLFRVPLHYVAKVGVKVGQMTTAEIPEPAPALTAERIEGLIGRGAEETF